MQVVEATLTTETYEHSEDFFFRSVHLGTECWGFIVHNRINQAHDLARKGHWHDAAAHVIQAARMINYLGEHILLLTR